MPVSVDQPAVCVHHERTPVYVDLSGYRDLRVVWELFFSGLGVSLVMAGAHLFMEWRRPAPSASLMTGGLVMSGVLLVGCLAVTAVFLLRFRSAQDAGARTLAQRGELTPEAAAVALIQQMGGLMPRRGPRIQPGAEGTFQQRWRELGFAHAPTLVDARLRKSIEAIEIRSEFLEPESALSQPKRWSGWMIYLAFVVLVYVLMFVVPGIRRADPLQLAFGAALSLVVLTPVLRSFGVRIGESRAPVVGLGVIEDHRGRRWTIDDSTLFAHHLASDRTKIGVTIAGPTGALSLRYWGVADSGFQLLWQRWMHPHPRTELS